MVTTATRTTLGEGLSLLPACPHGQLEDRVAQMAIDPIVAEVIASRAFKRLWSISFLGALDYIGPTHKLAKDFRLRADHSLPSGWCSTVIR
tara:strand:+ start:46838 stop:47110 length:273 start_codon:yes stop_codon:yes gene_type:complete